MNTLKLLDDDNINSAIELCKLIKSAIYKYDTNILMIIKDPTKDNDLMDKEKVDSANLKKDIYRKRKGLVTDVSLPLSGFKNSILASLTTKVTFVSHWSLAGSLNHKETKSNLMTLVAPLLAQEEKYPRLERLTLLGCSTATIYQKSKSDTLYLTNDIMEMNKIKNTTYPLYCCILEKKSGNAIIYRFDQENEYSKIHEEKLTTNEMSYLKHFNSIPVLWNVSLHQKLQASMVKIQKYIFKDSKNIFINQSLNCYTKELLSCNFDVSLYMFEGEEDRNKKKSIKENLPFLNTLFKAADDKNINNNLALETGNFINEKRQKKIEIKGYSYPIVAKKFSVVPLTSSPSEFPAKSIIYKWSK
ncbi:MAG: hypothetical protein JO131_04670 [Gammaproteobacteria bacterium]|nr:hypothetical protein [Gammaproteobacteria bacterium]